jgi:hypothetical protein
LIINDVSAIGFSRSRVTFYNLFPVFVNSALAINILPQEITEFSDSHNTKVLPFSGPDRYGAIFDFFISHN